VINKKNLLGKAPLELADKDAIHVAIVSVRAGAPVKPGERCKLNEFNEAVPGDGPGIADPFLKKPITTGDSFWLLLDLAEVPNVRHQWEHPTYAFAPPTREKKRNTYLEGNAKELGVTYEQLMEACANVVEHDEPMLYPGTLDSDALDEAWESVRYDIWSEWSDEANYEFENHGSACCPEYNYPETPLFKYAAPQAA
jgi:hypothetical protein